MKSIKKISAAITMLFASVLLFSCSNDDNASVTPPTQPKTPSEILASTAWETTGSKDQNGNTVALDDPRASNFVGFAYFNIDGTFKMYNLDDSPKMQGDWFIQNRPIGTVRTIIARNNEGGIMFTRDVVVTVLTADEFTYRVNDATDASQYVDIIHTPTKHTQPSK